MKIRTHQSGTAIAPALVIATDHLVVYARPSRRGNFRETSFVTLAPHMSIVSVPGRHGVHVTRRKWMPGSNNK